MNERYIKPEMDIYECEAECDVLTASAGSDPDLFNGDDYNYQIP